MSGLQRFLANRLDVRNFLLVFNDDLMCIIEMMWMY